MRKLYCRARQVRFVEETTPDTEPLRSSAGGGLCLFGLNPRRQPR